MSTNDNPNHPPVNDYIQSQPPDSLPVPTKLPIVNFDWGMVNSSYCECSGKRTTGENPCSLAEHPHCFYAKARANIERREGK
jgi:hypothetical protein